MKKFFDKPLPGRSMDQLQWLQNNARVYMMGLMILTVILAAAFWFSMKPWQPQTDLAFWENDSDQAVAEQQIPAEEQRETAQADKNQSNDVTTKQPESMASDITNEIPEGAMEQILIEQDAEPLPQEITINKETKPQTIDLLSLQDQLPGFTLPCNGELLYGYGIGYDPIYDDYRFHDAVCYQPNNTDALAVADGVVQKVSLDDTWQVLLQCGRYQIHYQGLQDCNVAAGDTVTGGQVLGVSGELLMVQVEMR